MANKISISTSQYLTTLATKYPNLVTDEDKSKIQNGVYISLSKKYNTLHNISVLYEACITGTLPVIHKAFGKYTFNLSTILIEQKHCEYLNGGVWSEKNIEEREKEIQAYLADNKINLVEAAIEDILFNNEFSDGVEVFLPKLKSKGFDNIDMEIFFKDPQDMCNLIKAIYNGNFDKLFDKGF